MSDQSWALISTPPGDRDSRVPVQGSRVVPVVVPVTDADLERSQEQFLAWIAGRGVWPTRQWHPGVKPAVAVFWPEQGYGPRPVLVCPECGEPAAACNPLGWIIANGPFPQWAHASDGEALCPVMTSSGYRPARRPIPVAWFEGVSPAADIRLNPAVERLAGGETP